MNYDLDLERGYLNVYYFYQIFAGFMESGGNGMHAYGSDSIPNDLDGVAGIYLLPHPIPVSYFPSRAESVHWR